MAVEEVAEGVEFADAPFGGGGQVGLGDGEPRAIRVLLATTRNVPEPAGALALAGLLTEHGQLAGKRVAVIQTAGNADGGLLLQVLAGGMPVI